MLASQREQEGDQGVEQNRGMDGLSYHWQLMGTNESPTHLPPWPHREGPALDLAPTPVSLSL